MSERRKLYQHKINAKLLPASTQEDREALQNERKQYTPSKFWNDTNQDTVIQNLYPQCVFTRIVNNVSAVGFVCRKAIFKNEIDENKIAKSTKPSVTVIIVMNLNRKAM